MTFAALALAFTALPTAVEAVKRRFALPQELPRKVTHVACGVLAASLPYFLPYTQIAVLAGLFVAVMAVSRARRLFTSLHELDRLSYGEVLFPVGVGVLALLHPKPWAFAYALLVLALADTAAAFVGKRYGRMPLPGGKTVAGSIAFLVVACAIGVPFASVGACILVAVVATTAEATLARGFDNLVVPVLAGVLIGVV